MTTYELIEQAVLDALGILEPEEQRAFEKALASANDDVKAQVREEQERMLDLEELLPDEAPRAELRDMVLSAVRAAMREESARPTIAGRVGPAGAGRGFRPAKRVSPVWRAAAIALGAATVAMMAVTYQIQQSFSQANDRALVDALYENLGAEYVEDMLFDEGTARISMQRVSETAGRAEAAIWHNPDWTSPRMFLTKVNTQADERLRLVVLDSEGNVVREVSEFSATGELVGMEIPVNVTPGIRVALYKSTLGENNLGEKLLEGVSSI